MEKSCPIKKSTRWHTKRKRFETRKTGSSLNLKSAIDRYRRKWTRLTATASKWTSESKLDENSCVNGLWSQAHDGRQVQKWKGEQWEAEWAK